MAADKSRIGPVLTQQDGLKVRETLLRVEPTADIYLKEKWPEGAKTMLPVVLLHGGGMDGSGWDIPIPGLSLMDVLAHNGSRTFAVDFRAHGRSSRVPDGRSVTGEQLLADTLAVLEHVQEVTGAGHVVLVGESMGAGVASRIAERSPERVAGVALLGYIYKQAALSAEVLMQAIAEEYGGYSYVREAEWANTTLATAAPEVIAWHQAQFGATFAFPIGLFLSAGDAPPRAPRCVTARVLIVTGDLDPLANLPDVENYLSDVGAAHKQHLYQRGVGHLPYVDVQAAEVQRAIIALVNTCTADTRQEH
jgi:pimeloyl-ACP methyl ester carboxylesterase